MLSINDIKKEYSPELHKYSRGILREYLQYQILNIVFDHQAGSKLSFLGGTALRIVYGLNRFSEDLDFDNKGLNFNEFQEIAGSIKSGLEKRGFLVEIRVITKEAFHCHIKFPKLLYEQGLSPLADEKILVQLDTFDQGVNYNSEVFILNKFDVLKQILATPKEVILAQKLWTITQRKRAKGRDYFDIMSLSPSTIPDKNFLQAKFGTDDWNEIKAEIKETIMELDFDMLARDVAPFLLRTEDVERIKLFPDYLNQLNWAL